MATTTPLDIPVPRQGGERPVYTGAAVIALALVFAGFAPTYFLKAFFGTPELTTLKHVHGLVMTSWFTLFLVQARLVAAGNTRLHRKLGVVGIALAALLVAVAMQTAIASARAGATPLPSIPPLVFLVMPVGEMVAFATLFTTAILLRKKSPWHKRFMLLASIAMLTPAVARLPVIADAGPLAFFAVTDLVIVGCIVYDAMRNRRVHPAFIAGLAIIVTLQLGRLAVSQTAAWMAFAKWLTA